MAMKEVGAKLTADSSQFKAEMKSVNSSLGALKAEMKSVSAEFQSNGSSAAALALSPDGHYRLMNDIGGLEAMKAINQKKAAMLYDVLDSSKLFKAVADPVDRSMMNVTFRTGDEDLDAKFVKESIAAGFSNLKGHRSVGGMRASIYNAMPVEGVEKLAAFMRQFEKDNL